MLQCMSYFLISLSATCAGAITGMGGGVILKPVLDAIGDFNVATIGVLSSITIFSMAVVSVYRQIKKKAPIDLAISIPLAIGAVAGGSIGQSILTIIIASLENNQSVVIVQNAILSMLIVLVFFYMVNKQRIPTLGVTGILPSLFIGLFLGLISSFLGIGGGPINVALIIYVFSFDTKKATVCSIISILFAQIAKLVSVGITTGFSAFDLSMCLPMVVGAVLGGLIGSTLNQRLSEQGVEIGFNIMQFAVISICIYNISTNISAIFR